MESGASCWVFFTVHRCMRRSFPRRSCIEVAAPSELSPRRVVHVSMKVSRAGAVLDFVGGDGGGRRYGLDVYLPLRMFLRFSPTSVPGVFLSLCLSLATSRRRVVSAIPSSDRYEPSDECLFEGDEQEECTKKRKHEKQAF